MQYTYAVVKVLAVMYRGVQKSGTTVLLLR